MNMLVTFHFPNNEDQSIQHNNFSSVFCVNYCHLLGEEKRNYAYLKTKCPGKFWA